MHAHGYFGVHFSNVLFALENWASGLPVIPDREVKEQTFYRFFDTLPLAGFHFGALF